MYSTCQPIRISTRTISLQGLLKLQGHKAANKNYYIHPQGWTIVPYCHQTNEISSLGVFLLQVFSHIRVEGEGKSPRPHQQFITDRLALSEGKSAPGLVFITAGIHVLNICSFSSRIARHLRWPYLRQQIAEKATENNFSHHVVTHNTNKYFNIMKAWLCALTGPFSRTWFVQVLANKVASLFWDTDSLFWDRTTQQLKNTRLKWIISNERALTDM